MKNRWVGGRRWWTWTRKARRWHGPGSGTACPPPVVRTHAPQLTRTLERLRDAGADLVVVDTGPREAAGAVVAARLADLVLVPCRPSAVDVIAVAATLREIAPARAVVVLNGCPARGQWTTEALDALAAFDVSPVTLGDRVAHRRAFQAGQTALELEPRSLAAAETVALYRSTLEAGK